uniref:substrate-binding domain-containing protein n=1 Tax=uncultured Caulobacter sp. TaxID=158749 RepID=UPI0025CDA2A4|nr:substrate-binding domain-containing protein [uncultured Caulobacter sp.]
MLSRLIAAIAVAAFAAGAAVAGPVHVYGPGGPAPAMKEAAAGFAAKRGVKVEVVAGPTKDWIVQAKGDADVIYSGSETMMSDFMVALDGQIVPSTAEPLYLRRSAILVRKGNPKRIKGLRDLMKPGHRVLVVNGAGQNGLWEDMAGRTGDIASVRSLRRNIASNAATSADAKAAWIADESLDAWIIWNIWQVANPQLADVVEVEPQYRIYRDTGVALTHAGQVNDDAKAFAAYLASPEAGRIFARWGWIVPATRAGHKQPSR